MTLKEKSLEPIAVIGMAFRFPGDLNDEKDFWQALVEGQDLIGRIGSERWAVDELQHPKRNEPGRSITFSAGVLSRIEEFDADFFNISPREAALLDPQQRLLLELSWEVMENAGKVPSTLAGSDCSVYIGISSLDFGLRGTADPAVASMHSMTGNTMSIAANRISYLFDLHGPSMAIDTACSSSFVALHQACNSLRNGESSLALVGGVNMLLHPYGFFCFTKASMISARGRCSAFDAEADGYVRSEGGAMLLLKPLSQAEKDGDNIHAVILASGTNADGGRKNGLTIPSSDGQSALMRDVLLRSGMKPGDVDYVEAHGTGTAVGDPIEAKAIGDVYGLGRSTPLPIGSVKTNLGHLEAASGLAGFVKTVCMLKNRTVPPSLHFKKPNENIPFDSLNIKVATGVTPIEKKGAAVVMGVNSFGFGGANAHVLLQSYDKTKSANADNSSTTKEHPPLFLSARTPEALEEMAAHTAECLRNRNVDYYGFAYALAYQRQHMECRLAVRSCDIQTAAIRLERFARNESIPEIVTEKMLTPYGKIAFIYSGNGAQWVGMGQQLLSEMPRFHEIMTELDVAMMQQAGFSILNELQADAVQSRLADTAVSQPLLFAIQVALTRMLREQGVEAAAVAGHSVGEVAAAWASGALNLEQAINVICCRSAAQALTHGMGRMAVAALSEIDVRKELTEHGFVNIEIAAINSPANVTLAGSLEDLENFGQKITARGVFFQMLDMNYAFHSRAMDGIASHIEKGLYSLAPESTQIDFISTVTGQVAEGCSLNGDYWWDNVRRPVLFARAIETLKARGCGVFIEIGPHTILQRYITENLAELQTVGRVLGVMHREDSGASRIEETVLRAHLCAAAPKLEKFFPQPGSYMMLPSYPWQRKLYRYHDTHEAVSMITRRRVHPLLGWRLEEAETTWENVVDPILYPYLADHCVGGTIVFPGAAYVEMALAASKEYFGDVCIELEDLDIISPIVFDGNDARALRFEFSERDGIFRIFSRPRLSDMEWVLNATGRLLGAHFHSTPAVITMNPKNRITKDAEQHYSIASLLGLDYGPAFQTFASGELSGDVFEGVFARPAHMIEQEKGYLLHPALLDACFQSLVNVFSNDTENDFPKAFLPVKIGHLRSFSGSCPVKFQMRINRRSSRSIKADFVLLDAAETVVFVLGNCRFRSAQIIRKANARSAQWRMDVKLLPHALENIDANTAGHAALSQIIIPDKQDSARLSYFQEGLPLFNAMVVSFIYAAFKKLETQENDFFQQCLNEPNTIPANKRSYFRWLVQCLQDENLLIHDQNIWRLEESDVLPPAEDIWRALLFQFPESLSELLFAGRIGRHLFSFLTTDVSQELSDLMQRSFFLQSYYQTALPYHGASVSLHKFLSEKADSWPDHRRLRILDLLGRGNASSVLKNHPEASRIDYVIAANGDVLTALKAECQAQAFGAVVEFEVDALELKGAEEFDVVIVSHWLHRRQNPGATLDALRGKLTCGGNIIIAERAPGWLPDFIFGVDESWWRETNDLPRSSLRTSDAWNALLKAHGFADVQIFTEAGDDTGQAGASLILASNPQDSAKNTQIPSACWLIISVDPSDSLGQKLTTGLRSQGHEVVLSQFASNVIENGRQELGRIDHVVYLGCSSKSDDIVLSQKMCNDVTQLVQAFEQSGLKQRLWIVTSGGALVVAKQDAEKNINPLQAPLWGLGRVIMNEFPHLECRLIDIDVSLPVSLDRLQKEFLYPSDENEIILQEDSRHVLRMRRDTSFSDMVTVDASRFRLDFQVPGQLRNLLWTPQEEGALADNEVEVRVAATGLNFRDVMYAMGLLPDEAVEDGFAGASLGLEFSGTVSRIGKKVVDFKPGDPVMGFGGSCFSSHVITTAQAIVRKPSHWSFAQAATVPTAFFTAYYALRHIAQLQAGEKILIHGGAGGVGIAAIQIAKHLGAEIFVTAGSDEKRDFLSLVGADHILDSRSLSFADAIMEITQQEGVDVVLNSLAGEAINRNLRILKPFGRFLELGKRDFYENTHIGLRPFKDNISYFGIDADQLLRAKPELTHRLFQEMMSLFEHGVLSPLPFRVFFANRVVEAFQHMQQSRHIGKIVVDFDVCSIPVKVPRQLPAPLTFSQNATYLVTGGLEGFGLETAVWMAEKGAGTLVLLSRRGLQTPEADVAVARIEAFGAQVRVMACDIADYKALKDTFAIMKRECPPVRGIFHAAAVMDDGMLVNLTPDRLSKVFSPKVLGAWNLHSLSSDLEIDYFVVYSSISTYIGNLGQGNYVAANAYLESLTSWRRAHGLAATCMNWGPIGDAGYLTRNKTIKDTLTGRIGAKPLEVQSALSVLESVLRANESHILVADFDLSVMGRLFESINGPRFETLRDTEKTETNDDKVVDVDDLIKGKSMAEVSDIIQGLLMVEVAKILSVNQEQIDPIRSLQQMGMDSLMHVELALSIEQRLGIHFPSMMLSEESSNLERLSRRLAEKFCGVDDNIQNKSEFESLVSTIASQHDEAFSDDDIMQTIHDFRSIASGEKN